VARICYISPFDPAAWKEDATPERQLLRTSDLVINTINFDLNAQIWYQKFRDKYPKLAANYPSSYVGSLTGNERNILGFERDYGIEYYIHWYRSYIPARYPLYLFIDEDDWNNALLLTNETTADDIRRFIWGE
jgi:hypothetical protein